MSTSGVKLLRQAILKSTVNRHDDTKANPKSITLALRMVLRAPPDTPLETLLQMYEQRDNASVATSRLIAKGKIVLADLDSRGPIKPDVGTRDDVDWLMAGLLTHTGLMPNVDVISEATATYTKFFNQFKCSELQMLLRASSPRTKRPNSKADMVTELANIGAKTRREPSDFYDDLVATVEALRYQKNKVYRENAGQCDVSAGMLSKSYGQGWNDCPVLYGPSNDYCCYPIEKDFSFITAREVARNCADCPKTHQRTERRR